MIDLIVNHHQVAETAFAIYSISYTEAAYIDALLLVNFNGALSNFHKRDLQRTLVLLFLFVLIFYLFTLRWMTYGIFGKNQKFEDFLIFVKTSPITLYECFYNDKNAPHWF